jgi:cell division protein FtsL
MSDKNELLEEVNLVINSSKLLNFTFFLYILMIMLIVFIFAFPKIYIQQQIYYKSRDIAKLKHEYDTLKEENRLINSSVESIKFKNQILDTLF